MKIKNVLLAVCLLTFSSITFAQKKKTATQPIAQEKQEIFQLIKKDDEVSQYLKDAPADAGNLMQSLTIKKMDLNSDGQPEYVAVIEPQFCGAHGNCPHWIYRKTGGEYNLLLRTIGQELKLEKTSTKKFRDLRSSGSSSASEYNWTIYKFDGKTYKSDRCFTQISTEGKRKPKITSQKCQEND
ncbi:MAG: hypothetical protein QOF02_3481 [Blastocatellia bacterium]|jgi:hypothetical protein|nr:hypothetical protein [Blastocatellia bacterium]